MKPEVYVSTKEAFAGMTPRKAAADLRELGKISPDKWSEYGVFNQFEETIFAAHPELAEVKEALEATGAAYVSMSGSGSAFYALFPDEATAREGFGKIPSTLGRVWLLELV